MRAAAARPRRPDCCQPKSGVPMPEGSSGWWTHESKATSGSEDRRGAQPPHTAGGNTTRGETAHWEIPPANIKIRRHQHTRVHAHTGPRRHTPIIVIIGPPKLAPKAGPGPGGQSKGTWTLVLARPHGVETKFQVSIITKFKQRRADQDVFKIRTSTSTSTNHKSSCPACEVVWGGRPPQSNSIAAQGGGGGGHSQYPEPAQPETTVVAETAGREG